MTITEIESRMQEIKSLVLDGQEDRSNIIADLIAEYGNLRLERGRMRVLNVQKTGLGYTITLRKEA